MTKIYPGKTWLRWCDKCGKIYRTPKKYGTVCPQCDNSYRKEYRLEKEGKIACQ